MNPRVSAFERLVMSVALEGPITPVRTDNDCWVWDGAKCHKGYGRIWFCGRAKRVHIVAWEFAKGRKVRKGYTLDHECRNKACWRPSHLEEVTRSVNTARGNRANPRDPAKAREAKAKLKVRDPGWPAY